MLDGRLEVTSPPGEGTRLEAHIPIEPGSLVAEARSNPPWPVHAFPRSASRIVTPTLTAAQAHAAVEPS